MAGLSGWGRFTGRWRTRQGAANFNALRSYISTVCKRRHHVLDALTHLIDGNPWLPSTT